MKFAFSLLGLVAIAQSASAHCESDFLSAPTMVLMLTFSSQDIFNTLVYGDKTSTAAVRQAQNNSPVKSVTSPDMRCNVDPHHATETVTVSANDKIGFKLSAAIFHQGPAAIYLGEAPGNVADWDGSGARWFKACSSLPLL